MSRNVDAEDPTPEGPVRTEPDSAESTPGDHVSRVEAEISPVERSPTRLGSLLAVVAALVAVASGGIYSMPALAVGGAGLLGLTIGVVRGSQDTVTVGAATLFAGVVVAGVQGAPVAATLVGTVATVFAWDVAGTAIAIGDQLGRAVDSSRIEVVHASTSALVGVLAATVGYGIYVTATGGQPLVALAFLLLASVLLLATLR